MTTTASPRRSDVTREAIRLAARDRFAADGYERATIRAIAADAAIDPSLVMRYFGSKEGLLAAAADFDLLLPDLTAVPAAALGEVLVGHFLDRWTADDTLFALLRTAVTHEAAAERMRTIFSDQLWPVAAALCPDPVEARTRAGLVATQMLGFALCRYVLRLPPVVALDRETVIERLGPTVQSYLAGSPGQDPDAPEPAVESR